MGHRLPPLLSQFARAFLAVRLEFCVSMHIDLRVAIRAGELDLKRSTGHEDRRRPLRPAAVAERRVRADLE
ncbi:hypothetical protein [Variovorax sp. W2I14]|uniref:hypothetical protein n=1 Tax=Variovorax sp. W2I14 TaxID=3042290 RepID=UPI003D1BB897